MDEERERLRHSAAARGWQRVGVSTHHGVNIPLFSLHSEKSCGIGEYPDLLPMIDWAKEIGLDVIQLLPLNDTGHQTSPYSSLSAFALNPLHLGLAHLPFLDQSPPLRQFFFSFQKLNEADRINYCELIPLRESFLQAYFDFFREQLLALEGYRHFKEENSWLEDYALFKALKYSQSEKSWEEWPQEWQNPSSDTIDGLRKLFERKVEFHCCVQFLCYQQLRHVREYAEKGGVFLKGDIPILINRDSADVWRYRSLFRIDKSAGAPPDMYAVEGQNWGIPLYNWEEVERHQWLWWLERLRFAQQFYHLYRLDHIVGFFRFWAIPRGKTGRDGFFVPEEEEQWLPLGSKILSVLLSASEILPIAEDLGAVLPEMRTMLLQLGICGTKVMRWERFWNGNESYIPLGDYPLASMTTVSTHDSDTLILWWKNCPDEAKLFAETKGWEYVPELSRDQLALILRESHHTASLFHINLLQEYLSAVDGMACDDPAAERVNVPGTVSDNNWSCRFRPTVEEIIASKALRDLFRSCLPISFK